MGFIKEKSKRFHQKISSVHFVNRFENINVCEKMIQKKDIMETMSSDNEVVPSESSLLTEYSSANDAYMHYDNFSWVIGSVLIAGTYVFWGLLFSLKDKSDSQILITSSILVSLIMSIWIFYASHVRQIYLCKLHRIHEIELRLGMKQHIRWIKSPDKGKVGYKTFGPKGHSLDMFIYIMTSLGTPVISYFKIGFTPWLLIPPGIIIIVFSVITILEKQIKAHLKKVN